MLPKVFKNKAQHGLQVRIPRQHRLRVEGALHGLESKKVVLFLGACAFNRGRGFLGLLLRLSNCLLCLLWFIGICHVFFFFQVLLRLFVLIWGHVIMCFISRLFLFF